MLDFTLLGNVAHIFFGPMFVDTTSSASESLELTSLAGTSVSVPPRFGMPVVVVNGRPGAVGDPVVVTNGRPGAYGRAVVVTNGRPGAYGRAVFVVNPEVLEELGIDI